MRTIQINTQIAIFIPKTAIVVFNHGAFGGAAKRYTLLYSYLNKSFPGKFYYFVNSHLYKQILQIFPDIDKSNIRIVDLKKNMKPQSGRENADTLPDNNTSGKLPVYYADHVPDPVEADKNITIARKLYRYYKNYFRQKKLFGIIESLRKELDIKVFFGVFGGIVPLTFYLSGVPRKASVIFSNMDSWFSEVHGDMKKMWYRKYYSFNYALENSDYVDFLSPFILDGVRKKNVKIKEGSITVAPCSFVDYSKCTIGDKSSFEVAFSARLEPDKNPMMFLEAAKLIHEKYPSVKFHLLGEGTLVYEIDGYIKTNGLEDSVSFQFHNNPPEIFARTSVFVSIQSGTNYPSQSVLEAMACGNAIIASNTGDTELFINENNGLLIDLSVFQLTQAIESLVIDTAHAHKLGRKGREDALKNHTIEKYTSYFTGVISNAFEKQFSVPS